MSALSKEEPTLSSSADERKLAKQLCLIQTTRAFHLIIDPNNRLQQLFEEQKLDYYVDIDDLDEFELFIKTKYGQCLTMNVTFSFDRTLNRPMGGASEKNLPKTLEVFIPKAIYFSLIKLLEDYINGKSFYCEDGDVKKGIEPFIDDIISICNHIC